ncbi:NACHT domain-containing protein [Lentzea aerocolonigenes]|uniref:NACHT domain-containing protein n=1 Tax=Lentzea aerocolonigenes TaxID=68170 RepID=UPI000B12298F|nr:NACHT domain-containing protein [Lentzea aerocolonigenes]
MNPTDVLATTALRLAISYAYRRNTINLVPDAVDKWPEAILSRHGVDWTTREMARQFESAIDKVSEELYKIPSISLENVVLESYLSALESPTATLANLIPQVDSLPNIHDKLPSQLYRLLLPSVEPGWDTARVNRATRACARSALMLCCHLLLTWTKIFPLSRTKAAWQTLVNTSQMAEDTRTALDEVRRADPGTGTTSDVVNMQRMDISAALKDIELFGLPVEKWHKRVPISISYLTGRLRHKEETTSSKEMPMDRLLGSLTHEAREAKSGHGMRLVMTGRAGSGKTTAVQWLAFTAAQGRLYGLSSDNRPVLPLFVRLREVVTSRYLTDQSLLYLPQLGEEVPAQWLQECSNLVTPLILLDGWDEIASDQRRTAEEWVESLAERYPSAHLIITSRPEGLSEDLFQRLAFQQVTMLPLQPGESSELARRWFRGLTKYLLASNIDTSDVDRAQQELLQDLTTPTISDMADSPLLTAMLCCLYADGHTTAPEQRGKLYDLVVTALLDARERERGECPPEWKSLDVRKKEMLVGGVARAMAENSLMTVQVDSRQKTRKPTVRDILADTLPLLGKARMEASTWTEIVLARSIVLQRVSTNEAEFAHRSIQDYLASKSFRASGSVMKMCELAEAGQWSILPFACYEADLNTVNLIVEWLVGKVAEHHGPEKRLVLSVLVECLGAATTMSPELRARAESAVETIFPPQDEAEMKALASLGNAAVSYLSSHRIKGASTRRLAIETLGRIGTEEALDALSSYARDGAASDTAALTEAFARFSPESYAKRVLKVIKGDLTLTVRDASRIPPISRLTNVAQLTVHGVRKDVDGYLPAASRLPNLRRLELRNCGDLQDLSWTTRIRSLRAISLVNCTDVHSLHEVGPDELWALHLESTQLNNVDWIDVLKNKRQLRVISLTDIVANPNTTAIGANLDILPTGHISTLTSLNTVVVEGGLRCETLGFLRRNSKLSMLKLGYLLGEEDVWDIARCHSLRTLKIRIATSSANISTLSQLHNLRSLEVFDISRDQMGEIIGLPRLRELSVQDSDLGSGFLHIPHSVAAVSISGCRFSGTYHYAANRGEVEKLPNLRSFAWKGGQLNDLGFLRATPALRSIDIHDNGSIESLDHLDLVPDGCTVRLSGTRFGLDEAPIRRLQRRCPVIYEPGYELDGHDLNYWVDLGGS